jgi:hypothetical protein
MVRQREETRRHQWVCLAALIAGLGGCAVTVVPNLGGRVVDAANGRPIVGAVVIAHGRAHVTERAETDAEGRFLLHGSIGNAIGPHLLPLIRITVSADCYSTLTTQTVYPPYHGGRPTIVREPFALERECPEDR